MAGTNPEQPDRNGTFCRRTRREFLWQTGGGFTGLALGSMLAQDGFLANQAVAADGVTGFSPLAPKTPDFAPKAKRVIFLFMYGGPSHVDLFDYKPELFKYDGKTIDIDTKGRSGRRGARHEGVGVGENRDVVWGARVVDRVPLGQIHVGRMVG